MVGIKYEIDPECKKCKALYLCCLDSAIDTSVEKGSMVCDELKKRADLKVSKFKLPENYFDDEE